MSEKLILIVTDNLQDQINGVVTTYKNLETHAILDGYRFVYLDPGRFCYVDCPGYNQVKIAFPWNIGEEIEKIAPDYIHIATEGIMGMCARQYLDKHGYRYSTAYHTNFPEGINRLFRIPETITWTYIRWFHKNSKKILTTTDRMIDHLRKNNIGNEISSWTRGVDTGIFNPNYRENIDREIKNLVCVSRVSKEKNLDDFCRLNIPDTKKIMIGDGPYRAELEKKYTDVTFVGFKTGTTLAHYYANADVFVFPSQWETFGIVMIESIACGTPVAAYPVTGPIDVIKQNVSGHMSNDLVEAIRCCLTLDRNTVYDSSKEWSWKNSWNTFRHNLVEINRLQR